jgi:D-3-phosphoglycerate dehydrogenase
MNSNQKNVLVTDAVHPDLLDGLTNRNWNVTYNPDISLAETINIVHQFQGLIINSKIKADKNFLERASNLKWIGRLGSGMEIIDVPFATARGIHLINTPEANCNAVAEHALAMLLCLFRNVNRADYEVRNKLWNREKNRGEELQGKTIGIIGYGHTGQRFEELLQGFNMNILVYDKYKQLSNHEARYSLVHDVNEIRKSAELISLHVPLAPETKYMIDKDFIAGSGKPFYLINTSRGSVVNTFHLLEGLRSGMIKGACLDVFENENPSSYSEAESLAYDELYKMDQVVLSPHIAGWTHQSRQKIAEVMLEKLDASTRNTLII